jgi:hypothetical protein
MVEHALTPEQIRIYDSYADAYQIIHHHLTEALKATNITAASGASYNRNAKSAARSAFESNKQRFFNHLLTAMKCPTLLAAIERDLEAGHAAIVQIVSTNEALLDRRLADIPTSEWADVSIDITPREYVLDYLQRSFPVQLFELFTDEDGHLQSRPVYDENNHPVLCQEALEARDRMIEHLASLPPVQGALDQLLHHFGTDVAAEVTGRSRRIVRRTGKGGDRLCVENRPASANYAETTAYMDDDKRILIFSDAGGTGRSYHADPPAAISASAFTSPGPGSRCRHPGLGRSNRTNQKSAHFPSGGDGCEGEKGFPPSPAISIPWAPSRGQRQTGGQGCSGRDI